MVEEALDHSSFLNDSNESIDSSEEGSANDESDERPNDR
jgi:hypothetical protein